MALRFGRPSAAIPFGYDQAFWGRRVASLGVGPEPLAASDVTVETLTAILRRLTGDVRWRERAAEVGTRIRAEDGVGVAADHVLAAQSAGAPPVS
jgi:sterol 3beta-glucosyltransferase